MNCLEFRRAVGAEPNRLSADAVAHQSSCPTCAKYAQEMQRLDGLIKRALDVPAPAGEFAPPQEFPQKSIGQSQTRPTTRWFAMAASVLLAFLVGSIAWYTVAPRPALARDIVAHMNHEPEAMTVTQERVSATLLDGMLQAKGMQLVQPLNDISYVHNCWVRRAWVPHVVVQTAGGPVAVIVLPHEAAQSSERFDEGGYHGQVVPMGKGSIVVIANDAALIDDVAAKVQAAITWK